MSERTMATETKRLRAAINTLHRYADQGEHYESAYRKIDEAAALLRAALDSETRQEAALRNVADICGPKGSGGLTPMEAERVRQVVADALASATTEESDGT